LNLVFIWLWWGLSFAEDVPSPERARAEPITVGDHTFIIPARVDTPFVMRQFTFRQGAGFVRIPGFTVEGFDESFTLALAGAVESVTFDIPVKPWVGFFGEVSGQILAGANADSAYFEGVRGTAGWEVGTVARLVRDERRDLQIGARLLARGSHGLGVEPSELVGALIADREATLQSILDGDLVRYLFVRHDWWFTGGALSIAKTLYKRVELIASVRSTGGTHRRTWFDGERQRVERTPVGVFAAGLATDIDLRPVPIDLQLEYRFRVEAEGARGEGLDGALRNRHFVGGGVFYGGRQDIQLGVSGATLLQFGPQAKERWILAELVLRILL
jgi:hypothetical protein